MGWCRSRQTLEEHCRPEHVCAFQAVALGVAVIASAFIRFADLMFWDAIRVTFITLIGCRWSTGRAVRVIRGLGIWFDVGLGRQLFKTDFSLKDFDYLL